MKKAGVPTTPGSDGILLSEQEALKMAHQLKYPVIIKAVAGGGGRGMRIARNDASLVQGYHAARSEAESAFANGALYMEKYLENPRHIEIQILADNYGNVIHLGERDCSVQRRNQKLIEEAPSPGAVAAAPRADRRGGGQGGQMAGRLHERRNDRVSLHRGRQFLFHGDEYAHSGRAPGNRGGDPP